MEQRRFGTSGLSVRMLSFGTMTIGGRDRFGKMGNFGAATIDTAEVYASAVPQATCRWTQAPGSATE